VVCPLCASPEANLVCDIPATKLVEGWQRRYSINIKPELKDVATIQLYACIDCSLRYYIPPGLAGSASLYAALDRFDWYYMPRKWEHDVAIQDLQGRSKVLEVGCGVGDFVTRMRENGWDAEGIELNDVAVQTAQARGLPVRHIDLTELAVEKTRQYDAVCSFQVLEHVPNTGNFLQSCCALLKPGGCLIVGVPNSDSYLRYQFNLLDMPPHHLTRWSPVVLERLPDYFPLRLVRLEREPLASYHIHDYVDTSLNRFVGPLNRQPVRNSVAWLILHTGLQKRITGHTVYAAYERT
jgi:2-polyprenyl-3-methyl-5-hydroxy-6-metoxy-1,4-benzoquinol methylase